MGTVKKPPSSRPVEFKTVDGKIHRGFYLKDANKYVRNVNRWKDTDLDVWFDDDRVVAWGFVEEQVEGQISMFGGNER